jgi:Flp pilus assembly protein TadG
LAVVAPLLFLFFFAAIEFGRLLMVVHGLESAAREACRVAIDRSGVRRDIGGLVSDQLAAFGVSDYKLNVNPNPPSSACQWQPVTVEIVVTYDKVSWLPAPTYLKGIALSGSCTLPQESDKCKS